MAEPDIEVEGPDGDVFAFPAGTPDRVMQTALVKHYQQGAGKGWQDRAEPASPETPPAAGVPPSPPGPQSAIDLVFGGEDPASQVPASETPAGRFMHTPAALDAAVRGAADTMTFGQADRIAAGLGALTGIGGAAGDYSGNLTGQQAGSASATADHPVASAAGKVGGAIAGAAGLVKAGVTAVPAIAERVPGLLGRALGVGADGAAYGGLDGAGHAQSVEEIPAAAAKGAGIGGAAGMALPVVGTALAATYRAAAPLIGRGVEGMSRGASGMLSAAAGNGIEAELSRLGPQATLADASPTLQGIAEGVARKPGDGQAALVQTLEAREAARGDRLVRAVDEGFGPAVSPAARTAELRAQRQAETAPMFTKAFAEAPPVDVTPVLADIGQALRTARGAEQAALQRATAMLAERGPNGLPAWTRDGETIHNVKVALDNLATYGDPALGVAPGALSKQQGALKRVRGGLNDALREQVPGYREATERSAAYAKELEAIEAGGDALEIGRAAIWPADMERRLAAMTPNERRGYFVGVRGAIENRVGTQADDLGALRKTLGGEQDWNRQKLGALYGEHTTQGVAEAISREAQFAQMAADVTGKARTASRAAGSDRVGGGILPDVPLGTTLTGTGIRAAQEVGRTALRAITGARSDAVRAELGDALSRQGDARDELVRSLLETIARRRAQADAISGAVGNSAAAAGADQLLAQRRPFGFAGR